MTKNNLFLFACEIDMKNVGRLLCEGRRDDDDDTFYLFSPSCKRFFWRFVIIGYMVTPGCTQYRGTLGA